MTQARETFRVESEVRTETIRTSREAAEQDVRLIRFFCRRRAWIKPETKPS